MVLVDSGCNQPDCNYYNNSNLNCSGTEESHEDNCSSSEEPLCSNWCVFPTTNSEPSLRCSNTCITKCENNKLVATSFDQLTIQKRIQNQSRASQGRYIDNKNAVVVASNFLNFTGDRVEVLNDSTLQWGKPYNLRNQSDQVLPSRSKPNYLSQFTNINVSSRGNSVKSTTTANKPGASTPGGKGVDVKHGSYQRYLDKKKGKIISLANPSIDDEIELAWYRQSILSNNCSQKVKCGSLISPGTINNIPFKFSLININGLTCKDKNTCIKN